MLLGMGLRPAGRPWAPLVIAKRIASRGDARATVPAGRTRPRRAAGGLDCIAGGDEGARTLDPRLAKPVLSQLSYVPVRGRV